MEQDTLEALYAMLSPGKILQTFVIIFLAWFIVTLLHLFTNRLAERFPRHRLLISRIYPLVRLIIWIFITIFIVTHVLRPSENVVVALFASAGIALGFAAQDTLRNMLGGIFMMFTRPFSVGDMVQIGEHYGEITNIDLNVTRLRTFNDNLVTIPNAEVIKQAVINANYGLLTEMVVIEFDMPATADAGLVRQLAWEAATSSPYAYLKKPVFVNIEDRFDRTFLTHFKIKMYVVDLRLERFLETDVMQRLKKALLDKNYINDELILHQLH
jgi:small-conductance mechanosensitive channel